MKRLWRDECGLTLVEVVVSMLLLSIGILTSVTMLAAGTTVNDINRDKTYALNLAEERMEYWKYRDISSLVEGTTLQPSDSQPSSYRWGGKDFKVLIKAAPCQSYSSLVQVEVVVSWQDDNRKGRQESTGQGEVAARTGVERKVRLVTLRPF
ncbi:MAG: type IV pilus modification PilV family protein [Eubacteriales bacterium]